MSHGSCETCLTFCDVQRKVSSCMGSHGVMEVEEDRKT